MKVNDIITEGNASGDHSLHDWFTKSKSSDGTPGWVQIGGKYAGKPCAKQPGQTTKPKCGSSKMKRSMSKKEEESAARRKRREDPNPNRSGKAHNVATKSKTNESRDYELHIRHSDKMNDDERHAAIMHFHPEAKRVGKTPGLYKIRDGYLMSGIGGVRRVNPRRRVGEETKPEFMKSGNMKPFKADGKEIPGAVQSLEKALVKAKERGIDLDYYKIDKIMQTVCHAHNLTGDELHNEFVAKHHKIPDDWIVKQLDEACWKGYHKEGNKKMFGKTYPNCVKNEDISEEKCPHCAGPMFSEMMINEKKDACYYKVKSRYKVWPSAYASGALVKCRKAGSSNWGNKSKK